MEINLSCLRLSLCIALSCFYLKVLPGQNLQDGMLVKAPGSSEVYLYLRKAKIFVPPQDLPRFENVLPVITLSRETLNGLGNIPADSTVVREIDSDSVFFLFASKKSYIPPRTFHLLALDLFVHTLPNGSLRHVEPGPALPDFNETPANVQEVFSQHLAFQFKYNKVNRLLPESVLADPRYATLEQRFDQAYGHYPFYGKAQGLLADTALGMSIKNDLGPTANDAGYWEAVRQNSPEDIRSQPYWNSDIIVKNRQVQFKPNPAMRGFADVHNHQFANLAFGGRLIAGYPYGENALVQCSMNDHLMELARWGAYIASMVSCAGPCNICLTTLGEPISSAVCLFYCGTTLVTCSIVASQAIEKSTDLLVSSYPHGNKGSADKIGNYITSFFLGNINPILFHGSQGYPGFEDWPKWNNGWTHQTVHEDALFRAYTGGLRLMVMLAVENSFLCSLCRSEEFNNRGVFPCNDEMASIYRQVDSTKAMDQAMRKYQNGWYKIVYTPTEMQQAVQAGKLAVVLGTENSDFLGCNSGCTYAEIDRRVQEVYDAGIRQVFMIHKQDNTFGGTSFDHPGITVADKTDFNFWSPGKVATTPDSNYDGGKVNAAGLTPAGVFLVKSLMSRGMLIDIDHLSDKSQEDLLHFAEAANYRGIISSHCGFNAINHGKQNHEGQLNAGEFYRLNTLGGMVGLILNQGKIDEISYPEGSLPHSCGLTTESFAQAYRYARANSPGQKGVAIGTDCNGPILSLGPRFGSAPCPGGGLSLKPALPYPFISVFDGLSMDKMKLGNQTLDINLDGVVTVGMLPDMLADLRQIGVSDNELESLMLGVKEYWSMWKSADSIRLSHYLSKKDGLYRGVPSNQTYEIICGFKYPSGANTNQADVEEIPDPALSQIPNGDPNAGTPRIVCPANITVHNAPGLCGTPVSYDTPVGIAICAGTAQTSGLPSASIFPVGTTVNRFQVSGRSGNTSACAFTVEVIDREPPVIVCPPDKTVGSDRRQCEATVRYTPPSGTDNCDNPVTTQISGLATGSLFPKGATVNVYQVSDASGLTATCRFTIMVEDHQRPTIHCPADLVVKTDQDQCYAKVIYKQPVADDNCPDVATVQTGGLASAAIFPIGVTTNLFTATDVAGLTATCQFTISVTDKQPPAINCPANITANTDPGVCHARINFSVTAIDNCAATTPFTISHRPGDAFALGQTTVSCIAEDEAGNTSSCHFTITIIDKESPSIICPAAVTVTCNTAPGDLTGMPLVTDNCTSVPQVTHTDKITQGNCSWWCMLERTWQGKDEYGNTSRCIQQIIKDPLPLIENALGADLNADGVTDTLVLGAGKSTLAIGPGHGQCIQKWLPGVGSRPSGLAFKQGLTGSDCLPGANPIEQDGHLLNPLLAEVIKLHLMVRLDRRFGTTRLSTLGCTIPPIIRGGMKPKPDINELLRVANGALGNVSFSGHLNELLELIHCINTPLNICK